MLTLPKSAIAALKEKAEKLVVTDNEPLWSPHPENKPQQEAYYSQIDRLFYGGSVGGGKGQACKLFDYVVKHFYGGDGNNIDLGTIDLEIFDIPEEIMNNTSKVLTPFGWKAIEQIKIGDAVMNPDGGAAHVVAIHDKGIQPLYRVTFVDGASVEVDSSHLWGYWLASRKKKAMKGQDIPLSDNWNENYYSRCLVRNTEQVKAIADKGNDNLIVPLCAPLRLQGTSKWKWFPPYTLGVLLGDGCLTPSCDPKAPQWAKPDEQIAKEVELETGCAVSKQNGASCLVWRIKLTSERIIELERTKLLGTYSHTKFIPNYYKNAPVEIRWALFQGLMDTDGYADERGHLEYTSTSEQLALDVQYLARSLGFAATLSYKEDTHYVVDGVKTKCRSCWRIYLKGNNTEQAFRLERKKDRCRKYNNGASWCGRRIVSIEPIEPGYSRCIQVSHPNGLYIVNDFIVTHNSSLVVGLALTQHDASIIFRREYSQLKGVIKESKKFARGHGRYNGSDKIWTELPEGRELSFGAVQYEDDVEKFQGRAHDFMAFDEICHFTRYQFDFLSGWNRPNIPGQRCRIVATGNPPTTPEGQWVREYWAPWLDKTHELYPHPPGEPIWYITVNSKDEIVQVGGDRPVPVKREVKGKIKTLYPHSRSFIPAKLKDNPYLDEAAYLSTLYGLPETLQKALIDGSFDIDWEDAEMQVIPSDWVEQAMVRWENSCMLPGTPLSALGVDVARGGKDQTVIVPRRGYWFEELKKYPGASTPDGGYVAGQVAACWEEGCVINIDVASVGSSPYDILENTYPNVIPISGGEKSIKSDESGKLGFYNKRAELYWLLREALDPKNGKNYCLPRSERLKAELCTPKWKLVPPIATEPHKSGRIQITTKEDVKDILGRSPDEADGVVYASHDAYTEFEPIQYNLDKRDITPRVPEVQPPQFSRPKRSRKGWK